MPSLNVNRVLLNPHLMDTSLTYVRNSVTVGNNGLASIVSSAPIPFYGVVNHLDTSRYGGDVTANFTQIPEGYTMEGGISIQTPKKLIAGTGVYNSDVINWHGNQYYVIAVRDYSGYGPGFVEIDAVLMPIGANVS